MESSAPLSPVMARTASRGFTLVEMLVVLAIIVVITAVVINGQSAYNQSLVLSDTAYNLAYSIREAQSLGLASRGANSISNAGFGVHFGGASSYIIFTDSTGTRSLSQAVCPNGTDSTLPEWKPGNCRYDSATDGIVETYSFSRGFTVSSICGQSSSGGTCTAIDSLDITFLRPETRAIMVGPSGQSFVCSEVAVQSPTGNATVKVRVSQLGEISVGQRCL